MWTENLLNDRRHGTRSWNEVVAWWRGPGQRPRTAFVFTVSDRYRQHLVGHVNSMHTIWNCASDLQLQVNNYAESAAKSSWQHVRIVERVTVENFRKRNALLFQKMCISKNQDHKGDVTFSLECGEIAVCDEIKHLVIIINSNQQYLNSRRTLIIL